MNYKTYIFWPVFFLVIFALHNIMDKNEVREISYSQFIEELKSGNIKEVFIKGENIIRGSFKNEKDTPFRTVGTIGDASFKIFEKHGIVENYFKEKKSSTFISMLINFIPWIVLFIIFYILLIKIEESDDKATKVLDIIKKIDEEKSS